MFGKNIISASYKITTKNTIPTEIILYFFDDGKLLWKKEFKKLDNIMDFSITSNGDLVAITGSLAGNKISNIINKKGNIVKEIEGFSKLKLSSDGTYGVGLKKNKIVYFNINDDRTIWEFSPDGIKEANSLDQTLDSNLIVVGFNNFLYILNKQGNIVQKYNLDGEIRDIRISSDSKYLMVAMYTKIAVFSNEIPLMKFPEINTVIEGQTPIFKWEDSGALKYLIKIDTNTFEVSKSEFIINSSLIPGQHEWSVKAIYDNGMESMWSYPNKFYYFKDPIPHLTFPDEGRIFEGDNITFKWEYNGTATKFLLNLSGTIYESFNKEFTIPTESFRPRIYKWSVKAIRSDGLESNWSLSRTFSISAPQEKIVNREIEVISQLNQKIVFVGGILITGVIAIFVRPYYKRLKVKRKMERTPTDWCPHCLKFTGGTTICPHCGKQTLSNIKNLKLKSKPKKD